MTLPFLFLALIVFAVGAAWFFRANPSLSLWDWLQRLADHPTYALLIRITAAVFGVILSDLIYMLLVRIWHGIG